MSGSNILRGEVWLASLDPVRGREQAGTRPIVIVSDSKFNNCPAGLVIAIPLTTRNRGISSHIAVDARDAGLKHASFAMCEQTRSVSKKRLLKRLGKVASSTVGEIDHALRLLLGL